MSEWEKLIEKLENEAGRSGAWEDTILQERIRTLLKKNNRSEAPHDVFLEICKYGLNSFKDYRGNPAESPAAPLLLNYLQLAFCHYLSAVEGAETNAKGKAKLTTAKRREFLAKSFGLTGNPGKLISERQRSKICRAFSAVLYGRTHGRSGKLMQGKPTQKDYTAAKRAAYKAHFGRDWINDDTAFQALKEVIVPVLIEEGYLPK